MKTNLFFILLFLFGNSSITGAQTSESPLIAPDGKTLDANYFKPKSLFYKQTWLDKDGKITREVTINNITEIDSTQNRLVYKQIRSDGNIHTSVAELPMLKPISISSISPKTKTYYDYSNGQDLKVRIERNGKTEFDSTYKMPRPYFDAFLSEYLLGALPLKAGYSGQFDIYRSDIKRAGTTVIKKVIKDFIVSGGGKISPIFLVFVGSGDYEAIYSIDAQTKDVLKCIVSNPDGSTFLKVKI